MVSSETSPPVIVITRIGICEKPMNVSYIVLSIRPYVQPETPVRRRCRSYSTTASEKPVHATSAKVTRLCSWNCAKQSATLRSTKRKLPVVKCDRGGIAYFRINDSKTRLVHILMRDSSLVVGLPQ